MLLPALADLAVGNPDWQVFCGSAAATLFVGAALAITSRGGSFDLKVRQAFVLTTLAWTVIATFGALPFVFADLNLSYTDAFFESMSGITTTGATVLVGLDTAPPGILMWRALLQWLGGIGIIVMALSILPLLQVGGMQLFRLESSDTSEKVLPKAAQIATSILLIYVALTLLCAAAYAAAEVPWFPALAHAMTTISTGGFSTSDRSMGAFDSGAVHYTAAAFMIAGALPFALYLRAVRGNLRALFRDSQVRWFFAIVVVVIAAMTAYVWQNLEGVGLERALQLCVFNVVSIITGTGYATADYGSWGPFAIGGFFFMMFIGGCAGSTTCGIKGFRFQVAYATARAQMNKLMHPHGVFIAYYNGRPIPESVSESVMSFFFLFVVSFVALAMGLGLLGLDFVTSMSGAASAIANVGPGLGPIIGPTGTFRDLPDTAMWLLSFGMLLGRLELFTVLMLIVPGFWRN
ncbi:MAG: TrkH family potassium uptake protein [Inquilinus sp.]|nr:TrkH family potassium uptake protein [Inquilinus sp.]